MLTDLEKEYLRHFRRGALFAMEMVASRKYTYAEITEIIQQRDSADIVAQALNKARKS